MRAKSVKATPRRPSFLAIPDFIKPISWWFTRGWASFVTIPVCLILLAGTLATVALSVVQLLDYYRVTEAVWGSIGFFAFALISPFVVIVPGVLWWWILSSTPEIYGTERKSSSLTVAVRGVAVTMLLVLGAAILLQWGHAKIIGWIADRDPEAAKRAGVVFARAPADDRK